MLDDVTEWKSDRISQKVAGRRLYGMIYEIPLIVTTSQALQTNGTGSEVSNIGSGVTIGDRTN